MTALGACLLASCGGDSRHAAIDAGPGPVVTAQITRDVDILFVMDNTASSGSEELVQMGVSNFEDRLAFPGGSLPNVRIGIISTDVGAGDYGIPDCELEGDDGMLRHRASVCNGPEQPYMAALTFADGSRSTNFQGTLTDTFTCNADPGIGCGFNQHFEAMRRALDGRNGPFLRNDAMLAVVFLVDEDDCSAHNEAVFDPDPALDTATSELGFLSHHRCFEFGVQCQPDDPRTPGVKEGCIPRQDSPYFTHPDTYVDALKGLKHRDDMLAAYAFMGDLSPVTVVVSNEEPRLESSCNIDFLPPTTPGTRVAAFVRSFARGVVYERCQTDFPESVGDMAASIISGMEELSCTSGELADVDDTEPGMQPSCEVVDVIKLGRPDAERQALLACADSPALPCYRFEAAEERCGPGRQVLVVDRDASAPLVGATTLAHCEGAVP